MRIGTTARLTGKGELAFDELIREARHAHDLGLDFWLVQLFDIDALTALAVIGREVPGCNVGTAVVPTYGRHPVVMAMQALTVQSATGGRLTLGIGLSHKWMVEEVFGLPSSTPVRQMREYLEILIPLLHEGKASYQGQDLSCQTIMPMTVAGATPPPVLVAALGTQMLNVTGRLADGTILWMVGPKTLSDHIVPTITRAAEAAGRPRPQIIAGLPVSVTVDVAASRERAARDFSFYATMPSYRAMLDREGAETAGDVTIAGDEESVATQLHQLEELGATSLRLAVYGNAEERRRTYALLAELARS